MAPVYYNTYKHLQYCFVDDDIDKDVASSQVLQHTKARKICIVYHVQASTIPSNWLSTNFTIICIAIVMTILIQSEVTTHKIGQISLLF